MKVSKTHFWVRLAEFSLASYESLPSSICPLFWRGIFGILSLFLFPSHIFNGIVFKERYGFWKTLLPTFLVVIVYILVAFARSTEDCRIFTWWLPFAVSGVILSVFLALYLVAVLGEYLYKKTIGDDAPEPINIATEFIKAKKNKICPLVEYTDD